MRSNIAFYGGSFDPVHNGHVAIAESLTNLFGLEAFVFIPAFHAPHKPDRKPTSEFHRYAMLCLATNDEVKHRVSKMELELPEKPYTVETLSRLKEEFPDKAIFFVMGADSWQDILTWRQWERVLLMTNHIVVTRPGYDISFSHVSDSVRERIVDLRGRDLAVPDNEKTAIYITDAVSVDISATAIRSKIKNADRDWRKDVPDQVANYIEKYQIYK